MSHRSLKYCSSGVGQPPLALFNPRIIDASEDADEQYEGCLSFFDVRGIVQRPLAHEIDHLQGKLYTDRMPPGVNPVPVERYHGTGASWRYGPPAD
jgi:peptide deformylase